MIKLRMQAAASWPLLTLLMVFHWQGSLPLVAQDAQEVNTVLMQNVFRISGPSAKSPGELSYGTGFVISIPKLDNPSQSWNVMVTAAHVLDDIKGETATITLRTPDKEGTYVEVPYTYRIRNGFRELYKRNPEADVAAAFISVPNDRTGIPPSYLVSDDRVKQLELHPGDEVFVLGFPLYTSLNTFPVLRSGILSSYPLTPMKSVKSYFVNFRVFPGNSSGPVYLYSSLRYYPSRGTQVEVAFGILGLIEDQLSSSVSGQDESLDISKIVPSAYIIDTLSQLGKIYNPMFALLPITSQ